MRQLRFSDVVFLLLLTSLSLENVIGNDDAGSNDAESDDAECKPPAEASTPEHEVGQYWAPGSILDISKELDTTTVDWDSEHGLRDFRQRFTKIEEGDPANQSQLKDLNVHTATHVDSPGHWNHDHYETGKGTEILDLHKLNGPVLVVEVPYHSNITAEVMGALPIPHGVQRLIFRTQNTARGLMHKTEFVTDYISLTKSGAEWIVNNTHIALVGIDYLSIAIYEDLPGPHHVLLGQDIIPVEGLVLDYVGPGIYDLRCLPLKLVGSDGAPARCVLVT